MPIEENKKYVAKDFASEQDIRWCPGCGDYSILKQVQMLLPKLNIPKEKFVFVSGIGCSSRFPYYMDLYGIHSIHGRATAIASGIKIANPELQVWVVAGDGDALSIGIGHTLHLLRRNIDLNLLVFNNEIYGLTKGQYSPTSPRGKKNKTAPLGTIDKPFHPISLALASGATFVARTTDRNPQQLKEILLAAHAHKGTSFVEIYQNCNIFNDNAFHLFTDKEKKEDYCLNIKQKEPLIFGKNREKAIVIDELKPKIIHVTTQEDDRKNMWIHDWEDICKANILAQFQDIDATLPRPFGIFYQKKSAVYEEELVKQIQHSKEEKENDLQKFLYGNQNWKVSN